MYQSSNAILRSAILAAVLLVGTAAAVSAGPHGGGGGHGGGYHGGGYYGGYHGGGFYGPGIVIGGGFYPYAYPYSYYSPYYSAVPYGFTYSTWGVPRVVYVDPSADPGPTGPPPSAQQLPPPSAETTTAATVEVRLPADAQLWFDDTLTKPTGATRSFQTPPLQADKTFHYTIRARWTEGGQVVEQSRRVDVRAGQRSVVDFTRPE